ncbi:NADPH-dependent FMN reductase-like domain-containing protein [Entamoeba marina]
MKVLALNGSYNDNGSSALLLKEFLKGYKQQCPDAKINEINLAKAKVADCKACYACEKQPGYFCSIQDKGSDIIEEIIASDVVVFAFPVYYFGMPGQVKNLVDRFYSIYDTNTYSLKSSLHNQFVNKKFVAIVQCAADVKNYCEMSEVPLKCAADCYSVKYHSLHITGVRGPEELSKEEGKLKQAIDLGIKVASH